MVISFVLWGKLFAIGGSTRLPKTFIERSIALSEEVLVQGLVKTLIITNNMETAFRDQKKYERAQKIHEGEDAMAG